MAQVHNTLCQNECLISFVLWCHDCKNWIILCSKKTENYIYILLNLFSYCYISNFFTLSFFTPHIQSRQFKFLRLIKHESFGSFFQKESSFFTCWPCLVLSIITMIYIWLNMEVRVHLQFYGGKNNLQDIIYLPERF